MKIISWNVNGLKSLLGKNGLRVLRNSGADIMCLQETRLSDSHFELDLPGYFQYYSNAERRGYSGTAILSRIEPMSVVTDIDNEGRIIIAEYDRYYIVCVYVPSSGSGRIMYRRDFDQHFRDMVTKLSADKAVIICGDLNTAYLDTDVYSPLSFAETPGFTIEERSRFGQLLSSGFVDAFRVFNQSVEGAYTWWSNRGGCRSKNEGMRLDYFLVSQSIESCLISSDILTDIRGSDHCPIELDLDPTGIQPGKRLGGNIISLPIAQFQDAETPFCEYRNPNNVQDSQVDSSAPDEKTVPPPTRTKIPTDLRFRRYDLTFDDDQQRRITRSFVVLCRDDGHFWFTNFHRYIRCTTQATHNISQHGVSRFDFIIPMLNYAFFARGAARLVDISVEIVQDYLVLYSKGFNEKKPPNRATLERAIRYIFEFLYLAINDAQFSIKVDDLYREVVKRNKHGAVYSEKVPVFEVPYVQSPKVPQNRDIPEKAFFMLLDHIVRCHTDMLGIVMLGAFVGCRPGEEVNVRCVNSPLGPGIMFTEINGGEVVKIVVDLSKEMTLRGDNMIVGSIKKERFQKVPDLFVQPFMTCYQIYEGFMKNRYRDPEFMPFTVNRSGKAMSYDAYYKRFSKIVSEMIPIYMSSDDPEIVMYGEILKTHPINPHIFRHFFTVQLVLSGISDVGELMTMRGDSSPQSALTYLKNKGALEKQYSLVNSKSFDYLKAAAAAAQKDS